MNHNQSRSTTTGGRTSHVRAAKVGTSLDPEFRRRQVKRHLLDLERDNFNGKGGDDGVGGGEGGVGGGSGEITGDGTAGSNAVTSSGYNDGIQLPCSGAAPPRKGFSLTSRTRQLKRPFHILLDESSIADDPDNRINYLTASVGPSRYPTKALCSVCGYWGKYTCGRCGMRYCSMPCEGTHLDTRCLKFVG